MGTGTQLARHLKNNLNTSLKRISFKLFILIISSLANNSKSCPFTEKIRSPNEYFELGFKNIISSALNWLRDDLDV